MNRKYPTLTFTFRLITVMCALCSVLQHSFLGGFKKKNHAWATLVLDRHGNPLKRALSLSTKMEKVSESRQTCLVFFPVCQQQAEQTRTAEPRGTHHTHSAISFQTWPTNLTTFPMPRMDNTSPHAARLLSSTSNQNTNCCLHISTMLAQTETHSYLPNCPTQWKTCMHAKVLFIAKTFTSILS